MPNVGREKAFEAAKEVEGNAIFPTFLDSEKGAEFTDFNDLARSRGLGAVQRQIEFELERGKARGEHLAHGREDCREKKLERESRDILVMTSRFSQVSDTCGICR